MLRRLASAGLMPTEARGNYLPKPPYLRETKTYHSQPLESIRHAGNYFVLYQYGPFLFFCCISYVKLLDYWRAEKNFSTSGGPLSPEARGICHMANPALRLATVRGRMRVSLNCWRNLGQFPHLPEYRGTRRGDESNHGILKLHHTPTHHNIGLPTSRPFAGSET